MKQKLVSLRQRREAINHEHTAEILGARYKGGGRAKGEDGLVNGEGATRILLQLNAAWHR